MLPCNCCIVVRKQFLFPRTSNSTLETQCLPSWRLCSRCFSWCYLKMPSMFHVYELRGWHISECSWVCVHLFPWVSWGTLLGVCRWENRTQNLVHVLENRGSNLVYARSLMISRSEFVRVTRARHVSRFEFRLKTGDARRTPRFAFGICIEKCSKWCALVKCHVMQQFMTW